MVRHRPSRADRDVLTLRRASGRGEAHLLTPPTRVPRGAAPPLTEPVETWSVVLRFDFTAAHGKEQGNPHAGSFQRDKLINDEDRWLARKQAKPARDARGAAQPRSPA